MLTSCVLIGGKQGESGVRIRSSVYCIRSRKKAKEPGVLQAEGEMQVAEPLSGKFPGPISQNLCAISNS